MAPEAPKLVLPTEAAIPTKLWGLQRFLMIGQAGCGKSTFWANDPNALFLDTEGNISHLAVKSLRIRSWEDFRNVYGLLYQANTNGAFPYSTIVVDTGDALLALAEEDTIQWARTFYKGDVRDRIFTIGDIPEGNGWGRTSKALMTAFRKLDEFPAALVIIAHLKNVKVKEPTAEYDKETVSFWGNTATQVLGWVKHTMHLKATYVGSQLTRRVCTLPSRGLESKSHGGIVPDGMKWESADLKQEWEQFRGLFE